MKTKIRQAVAWLLAAAMAFSGGMSNGISAWAETVEIGNTLASPSNASAGSTLATATASDSSEEEDVTASSSDAVKISLASASDSVEYTQEFLTAEGIRITIESDDSIWSDETTIEVTKVSSSDVTKMNHLVAGELGESRSVSAIYAYDITFYDDGEEFEPDGTIKVTFSLPEDLADVSSEAEIFHVNDSVTKADLMETTSEEENTWSCIADGFSVYGIAVTSMDYIGIYTAEDLQNIINNDLYGTYYLMNDIDLSGVEWTPIGDSDTNFSGTLDGQGYTISNLSYTADDAKIYAGLFGYVSGTIKNLKLEGFNFAVNAEGYAYSQSVWVGTVAALLKSSAVIENCHVTNCTINAESESYLNVGGITGSLNSYNSTVTNCTFDGEIEATSNADLDTLSPNVGGISGTCFGVIEKCINYGKISVETTDIMVSANAAGITGTSNYRSSCKIEQCANFGGISASSTSGNVYYTSSAVAAGIVASGYSTVTDCYNAGSILAMTLGEYESVSSYAGGIIGNSGADTKISNCYNIGLIQAISNSARTITAGVEMYEYTGGIVGYLSGSDFSEFANCYYSNVSCEQGIGGSKEEISVDGISCSIASMHDDYTYDGFDFKNVWVMGIDGYAYPIFQWQEQVSDSTEENEQSEIDESGPLQLLSVSPADNETGVETNAQIILRFNKEVATTPTDDARYVYIKDYDSDEDIYVWTVGGSMGAGIYINNALIDCQSSHCYIYIPENAYYAKTLDEETKQYTYEFFKGITDKDEYDFWMESDQEIYTATFDSMGGSEVNSRSFQEGTQLSKPDDPTKDGYAFIGWFVDPECTEAFVFTTLLYDDITLYAGWGDPEATLYIVDISIMHGDVYCDSDIVITFNQAINESPGINCNDFFQIKLFGNEVEEAEQLWFQWDSSYSDYTVEGNVLTMKNALLECSPTVVYYLYIPDGFFEADPADEEPFIGTTDPNTYYFTISPETDWKTVDFICVINGNTYIETTLVLEGDCCPEPNDPTWNGYTFNGWYTTNNFKESTKFDFAVPITESLKLYGKFTKNSDTATDNGSVADDTEKISNNTDTVTVAENSDDDDDGFTFNFSVKDSGFIYERINGVTYWMVYQDGKFLTGYQENLYHNGKKGNFYFDENGIMQTGWQTVNGKLKYFDPETGYEVAIEDMINSLKTNSAYEYLSSFTAVGEFAEDLTLIDASEYLFYYFKDIKKAILLGEIDTLTGEASAKAFLKTIIDELCSDSTTSSSYLEKMSSIITQQAQDQNYAAIKTIYENLAKLAGYSDYASLCKNLATIIGYEEAASVIFEDYTKNITILVTLKSLSSSETFKEVIDELIAEYNGNVAYKIQSDDLDSLINQLNVKTFVNAYNEFVLPSTLEGMYELYGELDAQTLTEYASRYSGSTAALQSLATTLFVDTLKDSLESDTRFTSADKVIASAYVRNQALEALKVAESNFVNSSSQNYDETLQAYITAYEVAKEVTLVQYENLMNYYSSRGMTEKYYEILSEYQKINSSNFYTY